MTSNTITPAWPAELEGDPLWVAPDWMKKDIAFLDLHKYQQPRIEVDKTLLAGCKSRHPAGKDLLEMQEVRDVVAVNTMTGVTVSCRMNSDAVLLHFDHESCDLMMSALLPDWTAA